MAKKKTGVVLGTARVLYSNQQNDLLKSRQQNAITNAWSKDPSSNSYLSIGGDNVAGQLSEFGTFQVLGAKKADGTYDSVATLNEAGSSIYNLNVSGSFNAINTVATTADIISGTRTLGTVTSYYSPSSSVDPDDLMYNITIMVRDPSDSVYPGVLSGANGTPDAPFADLQAAIDAVPKYINRNVVVKISLGSPFNHYGNLRIQGFTGGGELQLYLYSTTVIHGGLRIKNNSAGIFISGKNTDLNESAVTSGTFPWTGGVGQIRFNSKYASDRTVINISASTVSATMLDINGTDEHTANVEPYAGVWVNTGGNLSLVFAKIAGVPVGTRAVYGGRAYLEYLCGNCTDAAYQTYRGGLIQTAASRPAAPTLEAYGWGGMSQMDATTIYDRSFTGNTTSTLQTLSLSASATETLKFYIDHPVGDDYHWLTGNTLRTGWNANYDYYEGLIFFDIPDLRSKTIQKVTLNIKRSSASGGNPGNIHAYLMKPTVISPTNPTATTNNSTLKTFLEGGRINGGNASFYYNTVKSIPISTNGFNYWMDTTGNFANGVKPCAFGFAINDSMGDSEYFELVGKDSFTSKLYIEYYD